MERCSGADPGRFLFPVRGRQTDCGVDVAHELLVRELIEAEAAQFATIAGEFDAAEGQVRGALAEAVDPDHADLEGFDHGWADSSSRVKTVEDSP